MSTEYDKIAKQYKKSLENIEKTYSFVPTFLHFLKNIKNKVVLDLACGEGFFTRLIKQNGASKVIGIDISKKMIDLAKKEENLRPRGIKYFVYDATNLPKIDYFDLVTAVFLLNYAKTKEELLAMCKGAYKNLKKGGRFIIITTHPSNPLQSNKKYGFVKTAKKPLKEGGIVTIMLYVRGKKTCSFKNYFWKKQSYEKALKMAGFKTIKWHKPMISKEGIKKLGNDFWKTYLEHPASILIECIK